MAISKILSIGDCGAGYAGKHLRQALDYITDPQKTGNGEWVSALNCQKDDAYSQMRRTKAAFGKTDKRQGYHMIISFGEGETDAGTAFEIIGRFVREYLGKDYEALYAVHDNTEHIHGHIIFNSVSFRDGKKFRYEKGEWAKKIQPLTNRLCKEYGLSTIEISEERGSTGRDYKKWNDLRDGRFIWEDMIKRDMDACIFQSATYEGFLSMMSDMGYEVKDAYQGEGKEPAIKPMGLTQFRSCGSFGEEYERERIMERILTENLSKYKASFKGMPRIVRCRVKRYKRAGMSGIQKQYFARLYRTGRLKKRAYSQAWRYRADIRKMHELQEDYLFLSRHGVNTAGDLAVVADNMEEKKREISKEKGKIFKERAKIKPLFDAAKEMEGLQECENCYRRGEMLFEAEHDRWQLLDGMLKDGGYSLESLGILKQYYRKKTASVMEEEKAAIKEERIAKRILKEITSDEPAYDREQKTDRREAPDAGKRQDHKHGPEGLYGQLKK